MSPDTAEVVKTLLQLLLGPGGVILLWLSLRSKGKLPRDEVEVAETLEAVTSANGDVVAAVTADIETRWRDYADQMEQRLNTTLSKERAAWATEREALTRRMAKVERARAEDMRRFQLLERREQALVAYADRLRAAINTGTARPPAESWPPELQLTSSWPRGDTPTESPSDGNWTD